MVARKIVQSRIICLPNEKDAYLFLLLKQYPGRYIVFCNAVSAVSRLRSILGLLGVPVLALQGNMQQRARLKVLSHRLHPLPFCVFAVALRHFFFLSLLWNTSCRLLHLSNSHSHQFFFDNFSPQAIERFRDKSDSVLLATDVAARGLDVCPLSPPPSPHTLSTRALKRRHLLLPQAVAPSKCRG